MALVVVVVAVVLGVIVAGGSVHFHQHDTTMVVATYGRPKSTSFVCTLVNASEGRVGVGG